MKRRQIGQIAEPREDDHQIGRLQRLKAGNVADVRVDRAILRINREQHGAFEAMVLRQNLAQLGQGIFAAILFVACDEHGDGAVR